MLAVRYPIYLVANYDNASFTLPSESQESSGSSETEQEIESLISGVKVLSFVQATLKKKAPLQETYLHLVMLRVANSYLLRPTLPRMHHAWTVATFERLYATREWRTTMNVWWEMLMIVFDESLTVTFRYPHDKANFPVLETRFHSLMQPWWTLMNPGWPWHCSNIILYRIEQNVLVKRIEMEWTWHTNDVRVANSTSDESWMKQNE